MQIYNVILFLSIVHFSISQGCTDVQSPSTKDKCFSVDLGEEKKCCFFSYKKKGDSVTTTKCSPISTSPILTIEEEIETFKKAESSTGFDEFKYYCNNTAITNCYDVVNPAEKIVCTGRTQYVKEKNYNGCCFLDIDKNNKKCFPTEYTTKDSVEEIAKTIKEKWGLSDIPSLKCESKMANYKFLFILLLLISLV